jgi:alanine racemase
LAVALVEEAARLREAGIDAPILVLSECRPEAMRRARDLDLRMTLYSADGIAAAAGDATRAVGAAWPVHLKVDTGMHRVGASPDEIVERAAPSPTPPGSSWKRCGRTARLPTTSTTRSPRRSSIASKGRGRGARRQRHIARRCLHAANSAVALLHPRGR